jgi:molecular chaperone GrpE
MAKHTSESEFTAQAAETAAEAADGPAQNEAAKQRDEYYDLLLRKTAEFDNFRKRTERERQSVSEAAAADLITELLPLVDDFERALAHRSAASPPEHEVRRREREGGLQSGDEDNAYRRGMELMHRRLLDVLQKRGVRPIDALGADFDPYYHQAVSYEPAEGRREGEVIEEFRKGYMLGERLLRPTMVKVAKGQA